MAINIPEGYNRVMPYLILKNPEGFLEFMKNVFGATEKMCHKNEDGSVVHAEIIIGDSVIMIGGSGPEWQPMPAGLYIHVENADETYRKAITAGATSVMEVSDQSYGRSGGVQDVWGNTWWITNN